MLTMTMNTTKAIKRQIRHGVFETNSSSTHAVGLYYKGRYLWDANVDCDGDVDISDDDVYSIIHDNINDFTLDQLLELVKLKANEKSTD